MQNIHKIFLLMLFFITASNVYVSQHLPNELYSIVIQKDSSTSLDFLSRLKNKTNFENHLDFLSSYTGVPFKAYFEKQHSKEQSRISRIEVVLLQNPNQPQVLHSLGVEYARLGNSKQATIMNKKAHSIDPLRY